MARPEDHVPAAHSEQLPAVATPEPVEYAPAAQAVQLPAAGMPSPVW
jgi:hypothetical protein